MIINLTTSNLCFDDILLVPKQSNIKSRANISLSSTIGNLNNPTAWISLGIPVMTAPMEFINSNEMIIKIIDHGGMAFINKFQNDEKRFSQFKSLPNRIKDLNRLGFGIDLDEAQNAEFINKVLSYGVKTLVIDTALGHLEMVVEVIKNLRSRIPNNIHIMTGNVSSYEAYKNLMDSGADSVRVGIGGGAACITRIVTGFGVPVLASVMDIYKHVQNDIVNGIVSDGGIKANGDIVKALAAGASAVMIGSMFAGHEECDRQSDGRFLFRGLASESIKLDPVNGIATGEEIHHIEGVSGYVENKGSIKKTLMGITDNLKSGLSYCGSEDLISFKKDVSFIQVSSESLKESRSRI